MPSNTQWYYSQGGQQLGPVSEVQLLQWRTAGRFGPNDLVWSEGMTDWVPAGQVPQLQAHAPVAQAPTPVQGQWGAQASPNPQFGASPQVGYAQPAYGGYLSPQGGQSQQSLAIVGFVFSLLVPIVGLIISIVALNAMKTHGNYEGKGFATAGLIISLIFIVLGCVGFALCSMAGSMR
jgi:hypothetical protein